MYKKMFLVAVVCSMFAGCASVPMESPEKDKAAKQFNTPPSDSAGLYIYRAGSLGGALKKDVWVDGECVGETAPDVYFYEEVAAGKEHKISTESEFSPNDLMLTTEGGKNYFIEQYIKIGLFVGGAGVRQVGEEQARETIAQLKLAKKGICSK